MSRHFGTNLTEALDHVAGSASPRGAEAARTRGRQLSVRRRITAATLSCALMAGGAAAAVKATSPHMATHANETAVGDTGSPDGPRDPAKVVPGAMLEPADFPVAGADRWLTATTWAIADKPTLLTTVASPNIYPCLALSAGITGDQGRKFVSRDDPDLSGGQYYRIYPSADDAADSFTANVKSEEACGENPEVANGNVGPTTTAADGSTWSCVWKDRLRGSAVHLTTSYYLLRQGRVVEFVVFTSRSENPSSNQGGTTGLIPDTSQTDRQFLATLDQKLTILTNS